MIRTTFAFTLALAAFTLTACSDGMHVGSVHVKSGTVGAAGGTLTVTATDHPDLAGTSIVIPAGALADDTLIGIGLSDATLTLDDARPQGPALYFAPIGLALSAPATVTVPFDEDRASDLKIRALADGTVRDVSSRITNVDDTAHLVTFELDALAHVQPQVVYLLPPDGGCNSPACQPVDAGCAFGACPPDPDAGTAIDAGTPSCGVFGGCPVGSSCTPTGCVAVCGNTICPAGQGCNASDECVAQCGSGGSITFLCPVNEVCDFGTGTCHP
jgi:hypothetical protein